MGDPCKRQHPFRVGGKDLEGWRRTPKYVLPRGGGTSVASVLCKGGTVGLRRGRADLRRLSAIECGRLAGAQGGPRPLGC